MAMNSLAFTLFHLPTQIQKIQTWKHFQFFNKIAKMWQNAISVSKSNQEKPPITETL